ncbi:hypothetical protein AB6D34_16505 [Pectobacterium brasiliense]|uniref:Uncharacterized protein n=1 Tax=Pectobacterium brasiliense TaxID=180957 RepID=A0A3S0XX73_9GAMM|nr:MULTISPECIES: hypothetical protein [Pectobacterium]GKW28837.1 hypothetical protein PEC331060_20150 [Pectobacterium carotovorum subsp. carotovorum]MBN3048257.1 hypothetical protein [Pectobacterium brasiliense]MBN3075640.1 hypothetical protein [Pectobacterium brasiliense]MBN3084795.1 hypothetical protein [Pectobacterium brasiliense]MBN3091171.1 hypothetical protein [Pectobacterium brasiliense]
MGIDVYGRAAVAVVRNHINGQNPREGWGREIAILTDLKSVREKGCPKSAFLGLCEAGYVNGISPKKYLLRGGKNKSYAIAGAEIALAGVENIYQPEDLWLMIKKSIPARPNKYNQQMHVVVALKDAGLLQKPD